MNGRKFNQRVSSTKQGYRSRRWEGFRHREDDACVSSFHRAGKKLAPHNIFQLFRLKPTTDKS